jgi:kynurenine formamidase
MQSHYGATLQEDVDTISKWVDMQSKAEFVIHTGWAHHEKRAAEYASKNISSTMQHSPKYINALLDRLRKKYPGREFRQTYAIDLLAKIAAGPVFA